MGNFYNYNFTYLEIRFMKCVNSSKSNISCEDDDVIDNFVDGAKFSFAFVNTYFDFNDFNN